MMKNKTDSLGRRVAAVSAIAAFIASLIFFSTMYPYHLMRREQMNLFVYDWDYIIQRFTGIGWLSRLAGSFAEQFFCSRIIGPIIVASLLTAIGAVTFLICRKFLGKRISFAIAALAFIWSFLRECGYLFLTRYSMATLGFLSLILLALQFKTARAKTLAAALCLCFGVWALGSPFNGTCGKLWATPRLSLDRLFGMDAEVVRGNWDRVLELSEKDQRTVEASTCRNLALAMNGQLGNGLFDHPQASDPYYFLPFISGEQNLFYNGIAGELWYRLGDMTIAEQCAISCLQASPEHTGARYIERLACIGIITGEETTAQKYLSLLSKTLFYRKWATRMLDDTMTEEEKSLIEHTGSLLAISDIIHLANDPRDILVGLLEANPDNTPAREFLLCHDLLRYDLEQFAEDYDTRRLDSRIYKEAMIIRLGQQGVTSQSVIDAYGIDDSYRQRMEMFFRYPENYHNTYWYYYLKAINDSRK